MKCNPWRWLWGLIPILMLGWIAVIGEHGKIEEDLTTRTRTVLQRSGLGWANVKFEGRDAVLSGKAGEDGEPAKAVAALLDTMGVRVVDNQSGLIEKLDHYAWSAIRRDNRVQLEGYVPSDKVRRDVLGMVKSSLPGVSIDDKMKLARGVPGLATWLGGVGFGLKQLGMLRQGKVDLEQLNLSVSGDAVDARGYRAVKTALASGLPKGVRLKSESVSPPKASPYIWSAARQGKEVQLVGHVPNDSVRDELMRLARRVAGDARVVDHMEPASGAPDGFTRAAGALIEQLGALEEGKAEIRDRAARIDGLAETRERADAVKAALRTSALAAYKPGGEIRHREPVVKTISPYVTEARAEGGVVTLTGYVPDDKAREAIVAMARQRFAGSSVRDEMQIGAGQPPGWERCLETGLDAVQRLGKGRAALSDRRLEITGTTTTEALAQSLPASVRDRVGASCDSDVRIALDVDAVRQREEARLKAETDRAQTAGDANRARAEQMAAAEAARRQADEAARRAADAQRRKAEDDGRLAAEAARKKAEDDALRKAAMERQARDKVVSACQDALSKVVKEGVINFKRANFDLDSSSYPTLNKVALAANRCPSVIVEIGGYTDAEGTPERNQRLSDRRANAVREYLLQAGVDAGRLVAIGYGQEHPVAPNDTPENRARNRRIEFVVKTK